MSVKKRLFWSHILMFALPLVVYLLFSTVLTKLQRYGEKKLNAKGMGG